LPLGSLSAVTSADIVETGVTKAGILALKGGMVPRTGLPGDDRGAPYPIDRDGWVSTGYPARIDGGFLAIAGPRQDVLSVGGQSIALAAIDSVYADVPGAMAVNATATPDPVLGERLTLEAVPETGASLSASLLAAHAEAKGATPLAVSSDPSIGDRRKRVRIAGVA
jgi:acyl-CoA synthetase (AMP-forming)/AMP-acid ligase II